MSHDATDWSGLTRWTDATPSASAAVGDAAVAGTGIGTGSPADAAAKAKLRWRCRRGMRELDQAMLAYLEHHWDGASAEHRALFDELLDLQEPALYALVAGKSTDTDKEVRYAPIVDRITATLARVGGNDGPRPRT